MVCGRVGMHHACDTIPTMTLVGVMQPKKEGRYGKDVDFGSGIGSRAAV